jgi:hypothetical protein
MTQANEKTVNFVTTEQFETLVKQVNELNEKITKLTTPKEKSQKEMTDEHALQVLTGCYKDLNHNKAAQELQLSYGQIYSCRLEYTFRHITEKLHKDGWVNPWKQNKR